MTEGRARLREWLVSGRAPVPADAADAGALVEAAGAQGLLALLHEDVAASGERAWTPELRERLAGEHRRLLARALGQLDLMARVDRLLHARGLRILPLKGAALAEALYASAAERPMADVDALAIDDWRDSARVLAEAEFAIAEQADHAWSFVDPATGGLLELHRSVTSCPGVFALDPGAMWTRAQTRPGQVQRVPSAADLLVSLAQHALFQHGGVLSLVQWLDFRRLQERDPPDADALAAVARAARATACVEAALAAAAIVVGGPAPPASSSGRSRGLVRWLEEVRRDPLRAVRPTPPPLARLRWALAAGRRWTLVEETLRPAPSDDQTGGLGMAMRTARRAFGLVRRWGGTVLR